MPLALVGILFILILPMPTPVLDVCIALNITVSFVILFGSLYMSRPLDFSSFPAVLLVTTMFRLAMNVASTRLILLNGEKGLSAAGHVIQAFGQFVVGGNYAVGIVIFIAISIVNLKVITKGSGRIAEVSARFTLDAMPGKQMAIDSDLNTGLISEAEAKQKRNDLQRESQFYGAMDGAAKFVSGDAIAGLLLVVINIGGGLFIGMLQKGMTWKDAASLYTLLTIGDGLVSQIPSIIISLAAGLIVARNASGEDLNTEVIGQLANSSKPLFLTSAVCLGLAILPGLPFMPFITLAVISGIVAIMKRKTSNEEKDKLIKAANAQKEPVGPKPGSTEEVTGLLSLDILELEVGYELVSMVENGELVERIRSLRRQFALDYGFIVPSIHIKDNVRIKPGEYRVLLRGAVIGKGELVSHHLLAMDPGNVTAPLEGIPTKEPTFGLDAIWLPESEKERAQFSGYTVVEHSTIVTTHITELIRANMAELLGRQEVQHLVDNLAVKYPKVVEELIPGLLTIGQVEQVLARLLKEQISIRDLRTILETLADYATQTKNIEKLTEQVRKKLSRSITEKFITDDGTLPLVSLNPGLEKSLSETLQATDEGSYLALDPSLAQKIISKISATSEKFTELGYNPVILTTSYIRAGMSNFVERFVPGVSVISHQEIAPNTRVQSLGVINME
ncbi:MAG: flagellar biosynthesis protein FlhA [Bdellovibrionota bacterium]|nr:flagellar biosynthesis protein FlhA [Bdellovibrionota bacterium]